METPSHGTPDVVIVGGGFAGHTVLSDLRGLLRNRVRITLIDQCPHAVNRPMMPEIAFESTPPADSHFPMAPAGVSADSICLPGAVTAVDAAHNTVHPEDGQSRPYNILMLAPGPIHHYGASPGQEEFGNSLCDEPHAAAPWQALRGFRGGKVVIGSAQTRHGTRVPAPVLKAACEGPVVRPCS